MKKKDQIKYYSFVSKVLWEDWDPIGVNDYGGPEDEYNGYVPEIVRMLDRQEEPHQIEKRLIEFETVSMGLSNSNPAQCKKVTAKLIHGFNKLK